MAPRSALLAAAQRLELAASKYEALARNIRAGAGEMRLAHARVLEAAAQLDALRPQDPVTRPTGL